MATFAKDSALIREILRDASAPVSVDQVVRETLRSGGAVGTAVVETQIVRETLRSSGTVVAGSNPGFCSIIW